MIVTKDLSYECEENENQITISIFLTKGLWAVTTMNHVGEDVTCDPSTHICSETGFKVPIEKLQLGKAKDAVFFDTMVNTTIAASKTEKEVEVQVVLEGGKRKKTKRYQLEKKPGQAAKLRLNIEYVLTLLFLCCFTSLFAQETVEYEIDNMRAPANAAANLIGISESQIKLIENPTDFSGLIQTSTQNFTALPTNFGFQINPFGAFLKRERPADLYFSNDVGDNLLQTSLLSFAFKDTEDEIFQSVGIQFSLAKGRVVDKEEQIESIDQLYQQLDGINALEETSEEIEFLKEERLLLINEYREYMNTENRSDEVEQGYRDEIKSLRDEIQALQNDIFGSELSLDFQRQAEQLSTQLFEAQENRQGLRLDFASAVLIEFPTRSFSNSRVEQAAAWLTFSPNAAKKKKNDKPKSHDWLGIIRYQRQFNLELTPTISEDATMFDGGLKYLYRWEKLRLGGEFIYRRLSEFETDEIDQNSTRYLLDASYYIGNNNYLSFSYGKDFDEQTIQNGNVIAAINFIKGFGKKREISR